MNQQWKNDPVWGARKATDYVEYKRPEECKKCRLGVTKDGKVIHEATCGEALRIAKNESPGNRVGTI